MQHWTLGAARNVVCIAHEVGHFLDRIPRSIGQRPCLVRPDLHRRFL